MKSFIAVVMLSVLTLAADTAPELSEKQQLSARNKQLQLTQIALQEQDLNTQFNKLENSKQQIITELQKEFAELQDVCDKTKQKWTLNPSTLKCEEAKPVPEKK